MVEEYNPDSSVRLVGKAGLRFLPAHEPVAQPVTKFGGQPVWIGEPRWPVSRDTGRQLWFLGQIELAPRLFERAQARLAYLFLPPSDDPEEVEFSTHGLVLQPGESSHRDWVAAASGPSFPPKGGGFMTRWLGSTPREFRVELEFGEDPADPYSLPPEQREAWEADECKLGGWPFFMEDPVYPIPAPWKLLAQLDLCEVPLQIPAAEGDYLYAFIDERATRGTLLLQYS